MDDSARILPRGLVILEYLGNCSDPHPLTICAIAVCDKTNVLKLTEGALGALSNPTFFVMTIINNLYIEVEKCIFHSTLLAS